MLIDAHAHEDRYGDALPAALREIEQQRILTISNSMDLESYWRNLEIAAQCCWVLPIFGVHPWNAAQYATRLQDLDDAIASSPMLGEIELDHYFVEDRSEYPDPGGCAGARRFEGNLCCSHRGRGAGQSRSPGAV